MSKSDGRSDIKLTKELGIVACSCGRCCNVRLIRDLEVKVAELQKEEKND
jgi:hypothetical protein